MSEPLLNVKNLSVDVEEKSILHGINLTINKGETHVLMGPNGAGKSTLGCTLMGNPNYHVTDGEIFFGGENITKEAADKRAKPRHVPLLPEPAGSSGNLPLQLHPQRPLRKNRKECPHLGFQ